MDKPIKLKDTTCNGWVLVHPRRLTSKTAKNIHLVEVKFADSSNTILKWSDYTYCGEELVDEKKHVQDCTFRNTPEGRQALRLKVAELQNSGSEVCGNCAGHLYADPVA